MTVRVDHEERRRQIADALLRIADTEGLQAASMRAVAAEAGVSVGNAYYYFASKEQLIQAFYDRAQLDHRAAAAPALASETDLTARIVGVLEAWIVTMAPYRPFAGSFFKNAAEPTSPLSPFSAESTPARTRAIELWREVLEGSDAKLPKRLRGELPELMWLYSMGIVLFWVHDQTANSDATRAVVHRTAPLVVRTIGLTRLPVVRGMLDDIVALIGDIKAILPAPPPDATGLSQTT
jgi:AcrR family transcriptional regulator